MTRGGLWRLAAAAAATLIVGYFVVRQLNWRDLSSLWRSANLGLLALAFGAYLLANVLRARRFRALTGDQISTTTLLRTVLIQNFLNTFLPLRAGEVSYLYVVHRTGVVRPGDNLASLLGARALDLIAALWIPLLTLPMSRVWSAEGDTVAWFAGLASAAALTFAFGVARAEPLADWLAGRAATRDGRLRRGLETAGETLRALAQLRRGRLLGRVVALTFGCWGLIYICGYLSMLGLGIDLGFWDALFAYSFPMIASMTPLYMLGGFGVFEGSIGMGLHLVGIPLGVAMSAGLLQHIAELVYVILPTPFGLTPSPKRDAAPER
jgi:uncharacterized protein (TIRG00374 family)